MGQRPLVELQIQDGQRLIDRIAAEGIAVTAAAWVWESESGQWFLYLATPLVGADGATRSAYRRVNELMRELQKEGFAVDPFEVKMIGPDDPVAKALVAARDHYPAKVPMWFRGSRLGELAVEEAYIYPPVPAAVP